MINTFSADIYNKKKVSCTIFYDHTYWIAVQF